jgi:hypothetical protein
MNRQESQAWAFWIMMHQETDVGILGSDALIIIDVGILGYDTPGIPDVGILGYDAPRNRHGNSRL